MRRRERARERQPLCPCAGSVRRCRTSAFRAPSGRLRRRPARRGRRRRKNSAPGAHTGRNSVVPATSSLQSILPPNSRGSIEDTAPYSARGATAMMPMKGRSGTVGPKGSVAVIFARSSGICRMRSRGKVFRQRAFERLDAVVGPVHAQLDRFDAHLEGVARLCAAYRDRARSGCAAQDGAVAARGSPCAPAADRCARQFRPARPKHNAVSPCRPSLS